MLTKNSRGREYTEGVGGPDPAWLASRGQLRLENLGQTFCEREAGLVWVWKAGAECLRFAAVSQSLSQTGKPNPHLWDYRLGDW